MSASEKPTKPPSPPRGSTPSSPPPRFSDRRTHAPGANAPQTLHAPWRLQYLERLDREEKQSAGATPREPAASFLLEYWRNPASDLTNHVVVRTTDGLILLNAYPYATGHLLVALGDARPTLLDYTAQQRTVLWRLVDIAAALVQAAFEPQGVNIGINQGRAAGAGVPSHLHVHLIPRWAGDVNFITTVGAVRIIPASLDITADRYRSAWERIRNNWI